MDLRCSDPLIQDNHNLSKDLEYRIDKEVVKRGKRREGRRRRRRRRRRRSRRRRRRQNRRHAKGATSE
jgi:hypothetical protein